MITKGPDGWIDEGMRVAGRCWSLGSLRAFYKLIPPTKPPIKASRMTRMLTITGSTTDGDRDIALAAFDMVGANELLNVPADSRAFVAVGDP